jgi:uncharacterized integral membrane protein
VRDDRDLTPGAAPHLPPGDDRDPYRDLQRERQGRVVKVVVALFLLGVLIAFIVANSQSVVVHFVFVTRRPALIWVMFTCAILGGIIGYLIGRPGKQVRLHRRKDEPKKD